MRGFVAVTLALLTLAGLAGCVAQADHGSQDEATPAVAAWPVPLEGAQRDSPFDSFEPTLGVHPDGTVFLSTFEAETASRSHVARSDDHGATWTDVTPRIAGTAILPNSNDPYIHVDPDTGRVFNFDMHALACMSLSWSDDKGASWVNNPLGCHPVGVQDHQTFWTSRPRAIEPVLYPNLLHYCVNRLIDTACATSLDGGLTWGPLVPDVFGSQGCGGLTGHGVAGPQGRIYIGANGCGRAVVATSEDDGQTWSAYRIADGAIEGHDVNMAVDEAGNVYAAWRSHGKPVYAVSSDRGQRWSTPVDVAPPEVQMVEFVTLDAGGEGRIALGYYASLDHDRRNEVGSFDPFYAYVSVVLDAHTATPMTASAPFTPDDPIHRGRCDDNNRCRDTGDFLDLVIDADGRPWMSLVENCAEPCPTQENARPSEVGAVATLVTGPRLRGPLEPLPPLGP